MIRSSVADWLVHCADPQGARGKPPRHFPCPAAALELVRQARSHGVLGAVLRQFPPFANDSSFATVRAAARQYHRENLALATMLWHVADELMAAAKALPVALVKGPVFARALYPDPALRSFTDIDILAAKDAIPLLGAILQAQGFFLAEYGPRPEPLEWKWVHSEQNVLLVEVQTDLIHATSLRGAVSLPYEVIADGAETPAALLLIALVHGGAHQYGRLQQVVDICQAARALTDSNQERLFAALVAQTHVRFIAIAGLTLAGRMFNEPRCMEIASALGPVRYARLAGLLLGRTLVTSAMTEWRALHSWRRQTFRLLIRHATRY